MITFKEYQELNESFNEPYAYAWSKKNSTQWLAKAKTDDKKELLVDFTNWAHTGEAPRWSLSFAINNSVKITSNGDAYKIFATVLAVTREFIEQIKPEQLEFSSDKTPGESRSDLYMTLTKRFAGTMGYDFKKDTDTGAKEDYFILTKRKT